jgi:hypothetical protein
MDRLGGESPEVGAPASGVHPVCTSLNAAPGIKVFLLLFLQKKKNLLFLKKRSKKIFVSGAGGRCVLGDRERCCGPAGSTPEPGKSRVFLFF